MRLFLVLVTLLLARRAGAQPETVPPRPYYAPSPVYPEAARASGVEGVVRMRLRISERGDVLEGRIVQSSDTLFNRPALLAVRLWRFRPALRGETPVPAWVTLPIRFQRAGLSTAEALPVLVHHLPAGPVRLTFDRRDATPLRNPDACRNVVAPIVPAPHALDVRAARAYPAAVMRVGLWLLVRGDGSVADVEPDSLDVPAPVAAPLLAAIERETRRLDRVVPARCDGVAVDAWYRGRYAYTLRRDGGDVVTRDGKRTQRVRPALVFAPALVFD